ncbi:hypothetical protein [Myxococcus sp. AS-1-15]|jgi:hypothetical protein|uniref:hypothetical protein n=1 Tax=Myxococcus sp. AS-1-15 TaxID=2874600 RepID=UPI001CBBAC1E|nr:hypothetical protein [Myxococcus sp. AS-1-15]MBZ4399271.1 hypothetical protein [Myxococcus sp. AS-1-15]BDT30453.1 DUF3575 domain-containing protein [Myxococcus sp. MH1]
MNLSSLRHGLLSGLVALPLLAHAQEEAAPSPFLDPATEVEADRWTRSLNLAVRGQSFSFDESPAGFPLLTVNLEQQLFRYLSLYGGLHFKVDLDTFGGQVGTRVFFSQTFHEGFFVAAQASHSLIEVDSNTDGTRTSLGGLVGYSHVLERRWIISVGAGAQSTRTRTQTSPASNIAPCIFLYCKQEVAAQEAVSETEAVEPVLQLALTLRF